jgi:hypothetical protein
LSWCRNEGGICSHQQPKEPPEGVSASREPSWNVFDANDVWFESVDEFDALDGEVSPDSFKALPFSGNAEVLAWRGCDENVWSLNSSWIEIVDVVINRDFGVMPANDHLAFLVNFTSPDRCESSPRESFIKP